MSWEIETTAIGRIAVPRSVPAGLAVFCTSSDFEGRLRGETVDALAGLLRSRFGVHSTLASCGQVHGATVATVRRSPGAWSETPSCDALVSEEDGMTLAIKIADCLPIALFDESSRRLANIHSGWRGAVAKVVPATLETMKERHGTRPGSIRAWLGPSIRVCCFEVGEEVVDGLEKSYGSIAPWVDRGRGAKPHVDLAGLTVRILEQAGVPSSGIDDSEICTRCSGSIFHSFRRDRERSGRNLMVIGGNGGV